VVINVTDSVLTDLGLDRNNHFKGDQNVPVLIFSSTVPGTQSDQTTVKINALGLRFNLPGEERELLDVVNLRNMISSIRIASMQEYMNSIYNDGMAKPARYDVNYPVDENTINPVSLTLDTPIEFPVNTQDTMVVMVSFNENAISQSFSLALWDLDAYDVDPSLPLKVVDTQGDSLAVSTQMSSGTITIIPNDPAEAFITYPNPFGSNQEYANIRVFMPNNGDVEIRIFTMVGELVKTFNYAGETAGIHDGRDDERYRWNGKNDRGKTVLNGVYICVLRTKINGSTQDYIRKIAFIK